jgi:hypothetical protein
MENSCGIKSEYPLGKVVMETNETNPGLRKCSIFVDFGDGNLFPIAHIKETFNCPKDISGKSVFTKICCITHLVYVKPPYFKKGAFEDAFNDMVSLHLQMIQHTIPLFKKYADRFRSCYKTDCPLHTNSSCSLYPYLLK